MKKLKISTAAFAVALALTALTSCGQSEKEKAPQKSAAAAAKAGALPNFRYVDLDTLMTRYNLAKDFNEEMLRMQNNLDNTARQKETSLRNYAAEVQKKYQNNTYLTEAEQQAVQAEQQKMANMEESARRDLASLQQNLQNVALRQQATLSDSINSFIETYNAKKGYDAILFKGAGLYFNPALDITEEVVEGLNARYNKVNDK